jgi:hypothetical protein
MPGEQGCSAASRSTRVPKGPKSSSPLWRLNDEENKLKTNLFISTVFYWKHNNYTWNWYLSSTCKLKRMIQERPNQEWSVYKWSIAFSLWNFQTAQRPTILKIMAINCNERCTNFFSFLVPGIVLYAKIAAWRTVYEPLIMVPPEKINDKKT